jgi:hypothetical protein
MIKLLFALFTIQLIGCSDNQETNRPKKSYYVPPSVNYKGQFRKGYIRKPVSAKASAIRNQARSKYYYKTRGKYRRKKKND